MDTLEKRYNETISKEVQKKLGIKNVMATPKLTRIVLNMGVKDATSDKKNMERALKILTTIAGQKPKTTKAKKSIASFKLREGELIGAMVTLRGKRMYAFFDKLVAIVLPRLRDFHGVKRTSFDVQGNYTLGFTEYAVFPEIDPGSVEKLQGLEIVMVTSARNKEEGMALMEAMGMPFTK
ncbi:50S ribosomal protein L5 [soil metagenome]